MLDLVEVVDDVLLGTDQAVGRQLQFAAQLQHDAGQLFVGGLPEELALLVEDEMLGLVDEPLYVEAFLVEVFQFGNLDAVGRLVLEGPFDVVLQPDDVPQRGAGNLLEGDLDVAHVALLAGGDLFLQVIVHEFLQVADVLFDGGGTDLFVGFEQQFEEIEEAGVHLYPVAVLADHFFLDEQPQPVLVVFQQRQCLRIADAFCLPLLEQLGQQAARSVDRLDDFVNGSENVHNTRLGKTGAKVRFLFLKS